MKKSKGLLVFLVLFLLVVPLLSGCELEDQPDWTLQFATFWPSVDFQVDEGHKAWAQDIMDRVAEETDYTIAFEWHYQGSLLGPNELWPGVVDGSADVISTCPAYTAGLFPATEAFELPGYKNDNALVASMTMHNAWKESELLQEEYSDAKIMHFWATGPGDFMTNTPVKTAEDLKGLPIRAVGGTKPWTEALGADIHDFGMSASYENLETGVIDGLLAPTDVLKGFRLAEVTKYITKSPPTYNIVFMKAMNWDTWNAFPEEVQQIIQEVNEKYVVEYGELRTDHTLLGEQYGIEEYGMEVIELDPDEYQRWVDLIDPIYEAWIERANDRGLPGEDIVDLVRHFDAIYSEEYGDYGR